MKSVLTKLGRTWKNRTDWASLERDLDRLFEGVNKASGSLQSVAAQVLVFNNSGDGTVQNTLYGRDSSGAVAPALMGAAASSIQAKWLCLESVPPGRNFRAAVAGQFGIKAESLGTVTYGQAAWLSTTNSGQVTDTVVATVGQRIQSVGQFAQITSGDNSLISIDLALPGVIQVS